MVCSIHLQRLECRGLDIVVEDRINLVDHIGVDLKEALREAETAVKAVTTLPEDSEQPTVRQSTRGFDRISRLAVTGPVSEHALRFYAKKIRDDLIDRGIDKIDLTGLRTRERYHFNFLHSQSNSVISKLTPYAGLGMGLWHVGGDLGNFGTVDFSDNAFLFSMIFGIEYDLSEHVALTSDMRFNILGGTAPQIDDHFNYTWQIAGVRYRF